MAFIFYLFYKKVSRNTILTEYSKNKRIADLTAILISLNNKYNKIFLTGREINLKKRPHLMSRVMNHASLIYEYKVYFFLIQNIIISFRVYIIHRSYTTACASKEMS